MISKNPAYSFRAAFWSFVTMTFFAPRARASFSLDAECVRAYVSAPNALENYDWAADVVFSLTKRFTF